MKKELEKQNEAYPKADQSATMTMIVACAYNYNIDAIFYYHKNVGLGTDLRAIIQHNEIVSSENPNSLIHYDLNLGNLGAVQMFDIDYDYDGIVIPSINNRTIVRLITIDSFDPTHDSDGSTFSINLGEKSTSGGGGSTVFLESDTYNPSNAWDFVNNKWYILGFQFVYIKLSEFETSGPNTNTIIGYQVLVYDGVSDSWKGVIGTQGGDDTITDLRCVGAYNTLNFMRMGFNDITMRLKSETGSSISGVYIILRDQHNTIISSFKNQTLNENFTDYTFYTDGLDIVNNCYIIEVKKGIVNRKYTFPNSTQSDGDNDMSPWTVNYNSVSDDINLAIPTGVIFTYTLVSSNDDNNNDWCSIALHKRDILGNTSEMYYHREDGLENKFTETVNLSYTPEFGDTFYFVLDGGHQGTGTSNIGSENVTIECPGNIQEF